MFCIFDRLHEHGWPFAFPLDVVFNRAFAGDTVSVVHQGNWPTMFPRIGVYIVYKDIQDCDIGMSNWIVLIRNVQYLNQQHVLFEATAVQYWRYWQDYASYTRPLSTKLPRNPCPTLSAWNAGSAKPPYATQLLHENSCGDAGIWTRGLLHAKQALYRWATSPRRNLGIH